MGAGVLNNANTQTDCRWTVLSLALLIQTSVNMIPSKHEGTAEPHWKLGATWNVSRNDQWVAPLNQAGLSEIASRPTLILHFYELFSASCSSKLFFPLSTAHLFSKCQNLPKTYFSPPVRPSRWCFLHGWLCQSFSISFRNFNQSNLTPAEVVETTDEQKGGGGEWSNESVIDENTLRGW